MPVGNAASLARIQILRQGPNHDFCFSQPVVLYLYVRYLFIRCTMKYVYSRMFFIHSSCRVHVGSYTEQKCHRWIFVGFFLEHFENIVGHTTNNQKLTRASGAIHRGSDKTRSLDQSTGSRDTIPRTTRRASQSMQPLSRWRRMMNQRSSIVQFVDTYNLRLRFLCSRQYSEYQLPLFTYQVCSKPFPPKYRMILREQMVI